MQSKHSSRPALCLEFHAAQLRGFWELIKMPDIKENNTEAFCLFLKIVGTVLTERDTNFKGGKWKMRDNGK